MQILGVGRFDCCVWIREKRDCSRVPQRHDSEYLQFAASLQVPGVIRNESEYKAVGLLGVRIRWAGAAASVFDDDEVALIVRLNAFIAGAAHDAEQVFDCGWDIKSCLIDAAFRTVLKVNNRQQEADTMLSRRWWEADCQGHLYRRAS